jgi:hypothetical protein
MPPRSPAVPGNILRLQHGAQSPRTVEPVAAAIAEQVLEVAPYLRNPIYAAMVESFATTQAQLRLLHAWLAQRGLVNRRGRPWGAADLLVRLERLSLEQARELGLTPRARAALGRDLAGTGVDLARQWAMQQPDPADPTPVAGPDAPSEGDTAASPGAPGPYGPSGGSQ